MPMRRRRKKRTAMQVAKLALSRSHPIRLRQFFVASSDSCQAAWTQTLINGISLGDDLNNREGTAVLMKEVACRYQLDAAAAIDAAATIRVLLVLDKQANGSVFSTANLMQIDDSLKSFVDPRLSPSRFRVLYDRTHVLEEYSANATVQAVEFYQFSRRYKAPLKQVWNGAGATIGNIDQGALFFMHITDRTTNLPGINWTTKLRFHSP